MKSSNVDGHHKVGPTTTKHATFAEPEKRRGGSVGDSDEDTKSLEVRISRRNWIKVPCCYTELTQGMLPILGDV
jgi:hypothetical protein